MVWGYLWARCSRTFVDNLLFSISSVTTLLGLETASFFCVMLLCARISFLLFSCAHCYRFGHLIIQWWYIDNLLPVQIYEIRGEWEHVDVAIWNWALFLLLNSLHVSLLLEETLFLIIWYWQRCLGSYLIEGAFSYAWNEVIRGDNVLVEHIG